MSDLRVYACKNTRVLGDRATIFHLALHANEKRPSEVISYSFIPRLNLKTGTIL
jgi:hypothetical protein